MERGPAAESVWIAACDVYGGCDKEVVMDKVQELRKKNAELCNQAKAINEAAKAEERSLTEEEVGQIDELLEEAEQCKAEAMKLERAQAAQARLDKNVADLSKGGGRLSDPDAILQPGADVQVGRDLFYEDPTWGFKTFNEFCRAVKTASRPGYGIADQRLLKIEAAYGAHTGSGEEGGFLIAPEYSSRLYERMTETLPLLAQCDRLTLQGNSVTINGMVDHTRNATTYRYGGIIPYWVAEAAQITRSNLKFRQITLKLNKLGALSYVTEEELEDVSNFGERLIGKMGAAIADELVEAVMFGTGVGQPLGAFASDACLSTAKESGQAADTIVAENIIKMSADLWPVSQGNAIWYYNAEALPQLATMVIAVGAGGTPVYLSGNSVATGTPASLWGRPIYPTEHCEALGDAGDIVLGDFAQYLLATKGTVKTAMSVHLRFDYDEVAYKSTFRVDGRPTWEQSLRPRKGATAKRVSPWVKLAARA